LKFPSSLYVFYAITAEPSSFRKEVTMSSKKQTQDNKVSSQQRSSEPTVRDTAATTEHTHRAALIQRARFDPRSLSPRDVLQLQRSIGNQAAQRLLEARPDDPEARSSAKEATRLDHDFSQIPPQTKSPSTAQAKLDVSAPGDTYEQEADRVSGQVMTTPAHPTINGIPPRIQRFSGHSKGHMDTAPASVDQTLAGPGRPMEPELRQDMELQFGHDFSRVRVHTGTAAGQSAQDVNALAYTVGQNVVFGANQYAPATHSGRKLLAHELAHTIQQRAEAGSPLPKARLKTKLD
jgi:hypothetical protein